MIASFRTVAFFFLSGLGAAFLLVSAPALAIPAPALGAAQSFAVLGGSAVTAAGSGAVVTGDVGVATGTSITGFPPATVTPPFGIHINDAAANAAQNSVTSLYTALLPGSCPSASLPQLNGATFTPGTYCFSSTADLAAGGVLNLNGNGIYIFQVGSGLTANVLSSVNLNGADPCNVFWQVTSAATLNGLNFPGNVIAKAGITLGVGANLTGRALNLIPGPVTMSGTNTVGGCNSGTVPALFSPSGIPTLSVWAQLGMGLLLAGAAIWSLRRIA
jgi:Ice-binding-like